MEAFFMNPFLQEEYELLQSGYQINRKNGTNMFEKVLEN